MENTKLLYFIYWGFCLTSVCWEPSSGFYHEHSKQNFSTNENIPEDSLFGYSITYQPETKNLVVGAPKADAKGRVYTVDIEKGLVVPIKQPEVLKVDGGLMKPAHLLGANVKAGSNFFIMCSPRFQVINNYRELGHLPFCEGLCFAVASNGSMNILRKVPTNYARYEDEFKTFGWGLEITKNDAILVGGPFVTSRAVMYSNTKSSPNEIKSSRKERFNFGYSISSGTYFGSDLEYYAISTTYSSSGKGRVRFFKAKDSKEHSWSLVGYVGSSFGASMCTVSLGHGRDSLLVGAPTFAENSESYDQGAVYLYVPNLRVKTQLTLLKTIRGSSDDGYFGAAIARLGDLDGDSKDEVAIGAPYENDGRGAVYIYSAADLIVKNKGFHRKWIQKLQPEGNVRSFGFSITALQDYDDNGCNELAVAAPLTNTVLLYRCFAFITVSLESFPIVQSGVNESQSSFKFGVKVIYPIKPKNIEATLVITVEIVHPNARIKDSPGEGKAARYELNLKDKPTNYNYRVDVLRMPNETDYNQLMSYTITASLKDNPRKMGKFVSERVLLSDHSRLSLTEQVSLEACNGQCKPHLLVHFNSEMPNIYNVGSSQTESFSFNVSNDGDDAYSACLRVRVAGPKLFTAPQSCTYETGDQLKCSPNNRIHKGQFWETGNIVLDVTELTNKVEFIIIYYDLYTRCNDETSVANRNKNNVKIILMHSEIDIQSNSNPEDKVDINQLSDISHNYMLLNNGATKWVGFQVDIKLDSKPYLEYPQIETPNTISCTRNDMIFRCFVSELPSKSKAQLSIPIRFREEACASIEKVKDKLEKVVTSLELALLDGEVKRESVTTEAECKEITVALWIIILASVIGLIVVATIAFGLYKCGFLKRKKKEELKIRRRNVYRQSVQRQTMLFSKCDEDGQLLTPTENNERQSVPIIE